ncbi:MAG: class I SAM-dependent methyltransferase [Candidatus Methanoperedens sp.]
MTMVENVRILSHSESNDFWLNSKIKLFLDNIDKPNSKILDVGCGTGQLTNRLASHGHSVDAIDLSDFSVEHTQKKIWKNGFKDRTNIWRSTIDALDYTEKYDYIIFSDVLEHIENDMATIKKSYTLLKKDGHILISVPALKWLYGEHDIFCEHYRRYSREEICSKLITNNFKIIYVRYWSFCLVPIAFLISKVLKKPYPYTEINSNRFLNTFLSRFYSIIENKIRLPIGLSLFVNAKRTEL